MERLDDVVDVVNGVFGQTTGVESGALVTLNFALDLRPFGQLASLA